MRPNPLMATLIFFAWVTCFEPTVPCKARASHKRANPDKSVLFPCDPRNLSSIKALWCIL